MNQTPEAAADRARESLAQNIGELRSRAEHGADVAEKVEASAPLSPWVIAGALAIVLIPGRWIARALIPAALGIGLVLIRPKLRRSSASEA